MDGRIAKLESDVSRLVKVVEGNGRPGLASEFTDFMGEFRGAQEEREKQHKQSQARLNIIIAALIALAAYIAIVQTQNAHKSLLDPARIFHSMNIPQLANSQPELSTIPPLAR
jgi:hypothetical protein